MIEGSGWMLSGAMRPNLEKNEEIMKEENKQRQPSNCMNYWD